MRAGVMIVSGILALIGAVTVSMAQKPKFVSIQGRIVNLYGAPIEGASIEVTSESGGQSLKTHSDQGGNYKISNLPAGRLKLLARAFGSEREELFITLEAGEQKLLDLGLEFGRIIDPFPIQVQGVVQQPDGTPLRDATVTIKNAFNERLSRQVRSDDAGRYKVEVDNPGQYIVYVTKPGFQVCSVAVILPATLPRESRVVDLTLIPLRSPS